MVVAGDAQRLDYRYSTMFHVKQLGIEGWCRLVIGQCGGWVDWRSMRGIDYD